MCGNLYLSRTSFYVKAEQGLIEKIDPKVMIPLHTEHSELFKKLVKTKIIQPKYGKTMKIK
jgi:hypothetical protein